MTNAVSERSAYQAENSRAAGERVNIAVVNTVAANARRPNRITTNAAMMAGASVSCRATLQSELALSPGELRAT